VRRQPGGRESRPTPYAETGARGNFCANYASKSIRKRARGAWAPRLKRFRGAQAASKHDLGMSRSSRHRGTSSGSYGGIRTTIPLVRLTTRHTHHDLPRRPYDRRRNQKITVLAAQTIRYGTYKSSAGQWLQVPPPRRRPGRARNAVGVLSSGRLRAAPDAAPRYATSITTSSAPDATWPTPPLVRPAPLATQPRVGDVYATVGNVNGWGLPRRTQRVNSRYE